MAELTRIPGWRNALEWEEPHYVFWVNALTSEGLHDKADIAVVLAMLSHERDGLHSALDTLLTEVKNLNGYELTRDIETHKAQYCWDYAIDQAEKALAQAKDGKA